MTPANCEEVVAANTASVFPVVVKVPAVGKVTLVAAVVVSVKLLAPEVTREELFASVSVAAVAGVVTVMLFNLEANKLSADGTYFNVESEDTATPEPPLTLENKMK